MPGAERLGCIDHCPAAGERRRMRIALAFVALAAPAVAVADEPLPPAPAPPPVDRPAADPADGGGRYFAPPKGRDIVITSRDDRSTENITLLAVLGAAGVVSGGLGLYFNLDARKAAADVSADRFTGEVWTAERDATYDRANRSSMLAGVFYGIGGALLVGTAITYIV